MIGVMPKDRPKVTIYTDGSARPNPGPGGYGVVLLFGKNRKELSAGYRMTTNNRMEIMAAISGLKALKRECNVTLYSDSKYLVDSMVKGWVQKWHSNGWMRNKKERAENSDLWKELLSLSKGHMVEYEWIQGHSGNFENDRCDQLALEAVASSDFLTDTVYESTVRNGPALTHSSPTEPGEPCRKCGTALNKKYPKKRKRKPNQEYFFEWYLHCPSCNSMYMVEAAKRFFEEPMMFED